MKQKGRCSIVPPSWLSVENLEQILSSEQQNAAFSEVPFHYLEIAFMLLDAYVFLNSMI